MTDGFIRNGRYCLGPEQKEWMRESRTLGPPSWMEHPVYALARVAGEVAERENGMVCGHCVANHIIDVFDRYVRIHEPLHERS